jgi:hypothetical protein
MAITGKLVNRNPYLYGPGPVRRVPSGPFSYFGRAPPVTGFSAAAGAGAVIALVCSYTYKILFMDPQVRQIETYYKENPPR